MTRIHFAFGAPDRLRTACLFAQRRYEQGEPLVVYCADINRITAFDRLLWSFSDTAFVPHVSARDPLAADTPIVLTARAPGVLASPTRRWLLNLDDACAPDADHFDQLFDVVARDPDSRQTGRLRWRDYEAAGHTVVPLDLARQQPLP